MNFMRHYYDVYCLLAVPDVQEFIGTREYHAHAHKAKRFRRADNPMIAENEAFRLDDPSTWQTYERAYKSTQALYYRGQPDFAEVIQRIRENVGIL